MSRQAIWLPCRVDPGAKRTAEVRGCRHEGDTSEGDLRQDRDAYDMRPE